MLTTFLLKLLGWLLALAARPMAQLAPRLRDYPNHPELVALLRRGADLFRQNSWIYHQASRRVFLAQDVEGVPVCLLDVFDQATVKWLYERHIRFRSPARPLVLDIGANDGYLGSLSLNFVQLGWSAILIEPRPDMMAHARANLEPYRRPGQELVFVEAAVGFHDGAGWFETEVARDPVAMEGHLIEGRTATSRTVSVLNVETLMRRREIAELLAASDLVFLSVDIEGSEVEVTRRILAMGLRPHYMAVETVRCRPEELAVFPEYGYRFLRHMGFNDLYVLEDDR